MQDRIKSIQNGGDGSNDSGGGGGFEDDNWGGFEEERGTIYKSTHTNIFSTHMNIFWDAIECLLRFVLDEG